MKKNKQHNNNEGFQVPKGYFENLEERFLEQIIATEQQETPLPDTIDSGFNVPEDYFENLESKVVQIITTEHQPSGIRSLFSPKAVLYYSGIAALLVIIFTVYKTQKEQINFNTIALTEIQAYIDEGNLSLSTSEIESILAEDNHTIDTLNINTFSTEQLVDYLSEEEMEEALIFIE